MLGLRLGWVGGGWGVSFWKRKQDRGREPWMARWQAAAVTPPLRKASHHFVKPYRSQAESGKDRDGKIQEGIMFLCKSGCLEFDHARCKGWHFTNTLFLALAFQINKKPLITMQIKKKKKVADGLTHSELTHWTMQQFHSRCLGVPSPCPVNFIPVSINSCVMTPASECGGVAPALLCQFLNEGAAPAVVVLQICLYEASKTGNR